MSNPETAATGIMSLPIYSISFSLGSIACSMVREALYAYLDRRRTELGADGFDPDAIVRDEVNPALEPYGMQILVTEHDDGGVRTSTYALWFPPFARPTWGDR